MGIRSRKADEGSVGLERWEKVPNGKLERILRTEEKKRGIMAPLG